jgi:hypothetical protein
MLTTNGAAERKHRHIVEVGLSLLTHSYMPLKYWDEAFLAATYLINRTPAKNLQYASPLEVLYKEKPDYSMLRVFGCACWPNLRPYNARKLAFRSKRCAFLGYSNMHKGFKCLDIRTGRIYISRDVVFDEQVFPFASLHDNVDARLRSEVALLPPTLVDFSLPFGNNTTPEPCVIIVHLTLVMLLIKIWKKLYRRRRYCMLLHRGRQPRLSMQIRLRQHLLRDCSLASTRAAYQPRNESSSQWTPRMRRCPRAFWSPT